MKLTVSICIFKIADKDEETLRAVGLSTTHVQSLGRCTVSSGK